MSVSIGVQRPSPRGSRHTEFIGDELNVTNDNYVSLMRIMGDDSPEWCGSWDQADLVRVKAKILFVLHSLEAMPELDAGKSVTVGTGQNGATWIDCGQRPGYIQNRLTELLGMVDLALSEPDLIVAWG